MCFTSSQIYLLVSIIENDSHFSVYSTIYSSLPKAGQSTHTSHVAKYTVSISSSLFPGLWMWCVCWVSQGNGLFVVWCLLHKSTPVAKESFSVLKEAKHVVSCYLICGFIWQSNYVILHFIRNSWECHMTVAVSVNHCVDSELARYKHGKGYFPNFHVNVCSTMVRSFPFCNVTLQQSVLGNSLTWKS